MKKKVLVLGLGRFGSSIVKELHKSKHEVVACDVNEHLLQNVDSYVQYTVLGDAKDDSVMNDLSVENFDVIIVAIGDGFESAILITKKLKDRGCSYVIAKANDRQRGEILLAVGADRVIYPEEESGTRLGKQISFKGILEYVDITEEVSALELPVPSNFFGKSLSELNFNAKYGLVVAFILRNKKPILTHFAHETLEAGDYFFVIGENKNLSKFQETYFKD